MIKRRQLLNTSKRKELLDKIELLHSLKARSLVFEMDGKRFSAADCTNVSVDADAADDNISFQAPGDAEPRFFDLADIQSIKRLRTRKWLIKIKTGADADEATE